jgi:3-hydroxyisobutyrate dehydrogenase-like beta-hydroxyacid dehydrogenase
MTDIPRTLKKRIGVAGMGIMGSRMAANFLAKGYPTAVWNRTEERCRPLAEKGARVAATPRELGETSDIVVTCLADPNAVGRVVFAGDGVLHAARPGFRFVDTSTVSPGLARRIGEAFAAHGAAALEAPVTGSKMGAEKDTLLLMTAGPREVHDELLPVLMAIGSKAIYCGEAGQGQTMKLLGNTIISFMLEGFCEAAVVARKAGLPLATMIDVIQASGFASPYFDFKGRAIERRDFDTHFSLDLLYKDQGLMLDEASQHRVPMPGLAAIREVLQAARARGLGSEDIGALVMALESAAGVD